MRNSNSNRSGDHSFGHNILLLIRALLNIVSFYIFFYFMVKYPDPKHTAFSAILLAICIVLNVLIPMTRIKKRK